MLARAVHPWGTCCLHRCRDVACDSDANTILPMPHLNEFRSCGDRCDAVWANGDTQFWPCRAAATNTNFRSSTMTFARLPLR